MSIFSEFVHAPMTIGAVAASGRALTRAATAPVPMGADVVVVELGPGTGVMTRSIEERLAGRGRQLAIEVNARLAASLSVQHPAVEVVHADAADLGTVLTSRGIASADVIISGLPWAAFHPRQQEHLLDAVVTGLSPEGVFTTFAYVHSRWTPAARRFRRQLETRFDEVLIGRTVWPNLPPALVYYARRPLHAEPGSVQGELYATERPAREPVPEMNGPDLPTPDLCGPLPPGSCAPPWSAARASTLEHDPALQYDALTAAEAVRVSADMRRRHRCSPRERHRVRVGVECRM